jgi:alkylated DNA repair dioxygenase AlkB
MSIEPAITIHPDFWPAHAALFELLARTVDWDSTLKARLTASYGLPYDYSQMSYAARPMHPALVEVCDRAAALVGFEPNGCLLNYYVDGEAKMGFHSDQRVRMSPDSAVLILSLGAARKLCFRRTLAHEQHCDYLLEPGSLVVVPHAIQDEWQHGLPRVTTRAIGPRISVTLRELVTQT